MEGLASLVIGYGHRQAHDSMWRQSSAPFRTLRELVADVSFAINWPAPDGKILSRHPPCGEGRTVHLTTSRSSVAVRNSLRGRR